MSLSTVIPTHPYLHPYLLPLNDVFTYVFTSTAETVLRPLSTTLSTALSTTLYTKPNQTSGDRISMSLSQILMNQMEGKTNNLF